jgi:uncharacterized damage-inducible protein DinB
MWQIDVHTRKVDHLDFAYFSARTQQGKAEEQLLRTKAEIVRALQENGEKFASFVEGLDEAALQSVVSFPPEAGSAKSRFEMLLGPKEHEMHHRGQLMLVQRLLGQVPPLTRQRQAMMAAAATGRA